MTCRPLPPVSLGQGWCPSDRKSSRRFSAVSTTNDHATPSPGSRSRQLDGDVLAGAGLDDHVEMSSWLPVLSGASGLLPEMVFGDTQLNRKRPLSSAVTIGSRFGTLRLFAVIWTSAPLMLPSLSGVPSLLKAWMNTSPLLPARRSQDSAKRPLSS